MALARFDDYRGWNPDQAFPGDTDRGTPKLVTLDYETNPTFPLDGVGVVQVRSSDPLYATQGFKVIKPSQYANHTQPTSPIRVRNIVTGAYIPGTWVRKVYAGQSGGSINLLSVNGSNQVSAGSIGTSDNYFFTRLEFTPAALLEYNGTYVIEIADFLEFDFVTLT